MFVGHLSWRRWACNRGCGCRGDQDAPLQLSVGGDDLLEDRATQFTHAFRDPGTLEPTQWSLSLLLVYFSFLDSLHYGTNFKCDFDAEGEKGEANHRWDFATKGDDKKAEFRWDFDAKEDDKKGNHRWDFATKGHDQKADFRWDFDAKQDDKKASHR
jgi:hypothetical protein